MKGFKTKRPMKIWQGILLSFGVILLAVGGVFLYVHLTSGIGTKPTLPEDIIFSGMETDSDFNPTSGLLEKDSNFELILNSTNNATESDVVLSFTKNFTEIADSDGCISDGNIKILKNVSLGKSFEVVVLKEEGNNVGGQSTIYAKTENKVILPIQIDIAIDVKATGVKNSFIDSTTKIAVAKNDDGEFEITQGLNVELETAFTPENSKFMYRDETRVKSSFFEITNGVNNFVYDSEKDYFTANGEINSTATLINYTFSTAKAEKEFFANEAKLNTSEDELPKKALSYLKANKDNAEIAVFSSCQIKIVEATVSDVKMDRYEDFESFVNQEKKISASDLGVKIYNNNETLESSMIKNLAVKVLKEGTEHSGDFNTSAFGEVIVDGGVRLKKNNAGNYCEATAEEIAKNEYDYIMINSDVKDLNDAFWTFSSQSEKEYQLEFVLMQTNEDNSFSPFQHIANGQTELSPKTFTFKLEFLENLVEEEISWTENEMILETDANGIAFPSLTAKMNIPQNNQYKTTKIFAYDLKNKEGSAVESDNVSQYFQNVTKSTLTFTGKEGDVFEISNNSKILKECSFKVFFVTIKTNAQGEEILEGGKVQLAQTSNDMKISVTQTVDFDDADFSLVIDNKYKYEVEDEENKYVIPQGTGELNENGLIETPALTMTVTLKNDENATLLESQKDQIEIYAIDGTGKKVNSVVKDCEVSKDTSDTKIVSIKITFNDNIISLDKDLEVGFALQYNKLNGAEVHIVKEGTPEVVKLVSIYDDRPHTVNWGGIDDTTKENKFPDNLSVKDGKVFNEDEEITDFDDKLNETTISDRYGKVVVAKNDGLENAIVFESSDSSKITIEGSEINFKGAGGDAFIRALTDGVEVGQLKFVFNPTAITKIKYATDDKNDVLGEEVTSGENINVELGNDIKEISITKLGYKNNSITLANLVELYYSSVNGSGVNTFIQIDDLYFTIASETLNRLGSNANAMFGIGSDTSAMLNVTTNPADSTITSSTKITKFVIKHDFGSDQEIILNVGSNTKGINFQIKLTIGSNFESNDDKFDDIDYDPTDNTINAPEGGVFASYPINLNSYLVVTKKFIKKDSVTSTTDVGVSAENKTIVWNGNVVDGNDDVDDGKLTFDEVYAKTTKTITIKEVNNPFAYSFTQSFDIYPNFKVERDTERESNPHNKDISLLEIKNSGEAISEFFSITRLVGDVGVPTDLTYEVWFDGEKSTDLEISGTNFTFVDGTFLLENGKTFKTYTIKVKNGDDGEYLHTYKDENNDNQEIGVELNLTLGVTLEKIAELVADMSEKKFEGEYKLYIQSGVFKDLTNENLGFTFEFDYSGDEIWQKASATSIKFNKSGYFTLDVKKGDDLFATVDFWLETRPFGNNVPKYSTIDCNYEDYGYILGDGAVLKDKEIFETVTAGQPIQVIGNSSFGFHGSATNLRIVENYSKDGINLISVDEDDLSEIKINNLALNEEVFVVVSAKIAGEWQYFRLKISPNFNPPTAEYKGENDETEYVYTDDEGKAEIDLAEKFEITNKSGVEDSSLDWKYEHKIYLVSGGSESLYTGNACKVKFDESDKNKMTITVTDDSYFRIRVTRVYDDVVGGRAEFVFDVNSSNLDYRMKIGNDYSYSKNQPVEIEKNPEEFDDILVVTQSGSSNHWSSVSDFSKTKTIMSAKIGGQNAVFGSTLYLVKSDEGVYSIANSSSDATDSIATFIFNYATSKINATVNGTITQNLLIEFMFEVQLSNDEKLSTDDSKTWTDSGKGVVGQMNLTLKSNVQITETDGNLNGGTTINAGLLISGVTLDGAVEEDFTATIVGVTDENGNTINFVRVADGNATIAMLNEDKTAVFKVKVTVDSVDYFFFITKTIEANALYENGDSLTDDENDAPTLNLSGEYFAGDGKTVALAKYLKLAEGTSDNGTFSMTTSSELESSSIDDTGAITFATNNVAQVENQKLTFVVTYGFDTFSYSFVVKFRLTVLPNTTIEINYPQPFEGAGLEYETIKSGSNLPDLEGKHELASESRVVIIKKGTSITSDITYTIESKDSTVTVKRDGTDIAVGDTITTGDTITGTGYLTVKITCNGVSANYKFYVTDQEVYSFKNNLIANDGKEDIYVDSIENKNIFAPNRILKVENPNSILVNGNKVELKKDDSNVIEFTFNSNIHIGEVFFIDMGKTIDDIENYKVWINDAELSNVEDIKISTTQRIVMTYYTKEGYVEIPSEKHSGQVTGLTDGTSPYSKSFSDFSLEGLLASKEYTATFKLQIGDDTTATVSNQTYKFELGLDITVEHAIEANNGITYIEITARDGVERNLNEIAQIKKPSTGQLIEDDILGNGVTVSFEVIKDKENDVWNKFNIEGITNATQKMQGGTQYFGFTPIKNGENEDDLAYNWYVQAYGAENVGSWILTKYTYTANGISEEFHIMFRILPNIIFQVGTQSFTEIQEDDNDSFKESISSNENDVYESPIEGVNHEFNVIGGSGDDAGVMKIFRNENESIEKEGEKVGGIPASNWTYSLTAEGDDLNQQLTKFTGLKNIPINPTNGWTESGSTYTYNVDGDGNKTLTIQRNPLVVFGELTYKMVIKDRFDYTIEFWFKLAPAPDKVQNPVIETNPGIITEGDSFDIGAVYDKILISDTEVDVLNVYDGADVVGSVVGDELKLGIDTFEISNNEDVMTTISGTAQEFIVTEIDENDFDVSMTDDSVIFTGSASKDTFVAKVKTEFTVTAGTGNNTDKNKLTTNTAVTITDVSENNYKISYTITNGTSSTTYNAISALKTNISVMLAEGKSIDMFVGPKVISDTTIALTVTAIGESDLGVSYKGSNNITYIGTVAKDDTSFIEITVGNTVTLNENKSIDMSVSPKVIDNTTPLTVKVIENEDLGVSFVKDGITYIGTVAKGDTNFEEGTTEIEDTVTLNENKSIDRIVDPKVIDDTTTALTVTAIGESDLGVSFKDSNNITYIGTVAKADTSFNIVTLIQDKTANLYANSQKKATGNGLTYNIFTNGDISIGTKIVGYGNLYTVKSEKAKATTIESIAPQNGSVAMFNIGGLNAFGFKALVNEEEVIVTEEDADDIQLAKLKGLEDKYFEYDEMILQYLTVDSVHFEKDGFNVGSVPLTSPPANLTTLDRKLITDASLRIKDNGGNNLLGDDDDHFISPRDSGASLKIPELDSWIYENVNDDNGNRVESATVNMIVNLKYSKRTGNDEDTGIYPVVFPITVQRKMQVDKSQEATVADGKAFTIEEELLEVNYTGTSTPTILDDTLFVYLPAKNSNTSSKLKVKVEVDSAPTGTTFTPDASCEQTFTNSNTSKPSMHTLFLSDKLYTEDGERYILKPGDEVRFTFTGFENNGTSDEITKFFARYGNTTWSGGVDEEYIDWDTDPDPAITGKIDIEITDDSKDDVYDIKYTVGETEYTGTISKDNTAFKELTDTVTISAITNDTIYIPNSSLFDQDGDFGVYAHVTKSYVIVNNDKSYREEKKFNVTPFYYNINEKKSDDPAISVYVDDTKDGGYVSNFASWTSGLSTFDGTGVSSVVRDEGLEESGSLESSSLVYNDIKDKVQFTVGTNGEIGTAEIDKSSGNIITNDEYTIGDDQYVQINIYAKESGVDGQFSSDVIDENLLIGIVKIQFVEGSATENDDDYTTAAWTTSVDENGVVTITGYIGSATTVTLPYARDFGGKTIVIGSLVTEEVDSNGSTITDIKLNNDVTSVGANAFKEFTALTTISIPNSVTSIGAGAFDGCTELTTVTFEEISKITTIGDNAFDGCSKLTSITIPNSVTSIGAGAFDGTDIYKSAGENSFVTVGKWIVAIKGTPTEDPTKTNFADEIKDQIADIFEEKSFYVDLTTATDQFQAGATFVSIVIGGEKIATTKERFIFDGTQSIENIIQGLIANNPDEIGANEHQWDYKVERVGGVNSRILKITPLQFSKIISITNTTTFKLVGLGGHTPRQPDDQKVYDSID